jgi:hypothetical protein
MSTWHASPNNEVWVKAMMKVMHAASGTLDPLHHPLRAGDRHRADGEHPPLSGPAAQLGSADEARRIEAHHCN